MEKDGDKNDQDKQNTPKVKDCRQKNPKRSIEYFFFRREQRLQRNQSPQRQEYKKIRNNQVCVD